MSALFASYASVVQAEPSGFTERRIFKNSFMTDMAWDSQHRMFLTQKIGIVHLYEPGDDYDYDDDDSIQILDIQDIVCTESERALGGIQLHPNFDTNNWM